MSKPFSRLCSYFSTTLQTILKMLFSIIILITIYPLLIIFSIFNRVVNFILKCYFIVFTKRKYTLMSPEDAVWAYEVEASYSIIQIFSVCEGRCDIEKIRKRFLTTFANVEKNHGGKMRLRIAKIFGYFCWEDCSETFDINKVVRCLDNNVESPVVNEREILELKGKLFDKEINPGSDQPHWEVLVVPNYIPEWAEQKNIYPTINEGGFSQEKHYYGVMVRMHHSYVDGVAFTQRLQQTIGDNVVKCAFDPFEPVKTPFYKTIAAYLTVLLLGPYASLTSSFRRGKNFLPRQTLRGPKTFGWTKKFSTDKLKKIKSETGASITAIINCAITASLRSLAVIRGEVPKQVNGVLAVAKFPYGWMKPQNRFSPILFNIDLSLDSVEKRLKAAHETIENMKTAPDFLLNYWIIRITGSVPCFLLKFGYDGMDIAVGFANVPGPLGPLTLFDGDEQVDIGGCGPIKATTGVGCTAYSYNGFMRVGVVCDGNVLPDPQCMKKVLEAFENEIEEMDNLVACATPEIIIV